MDPENVHSRRSALGSIGGLVESALLGGAGLARTNSQESSASDAAPSVEWSRQYGGERRAYELYDLVTVLQADDGGYTLPAEGAPVQRSGVEEPQFGLVRVAADGTKQWGRSRTPWAGRATSTPRASRTSPPPATVMVPGGPPTRRRTRRPRPTTVRTNRATLSVLSSILRKICDI